MNALFDLFLGWFRAAERREPSARQAADAGPGKKRAKKSQRGRPSPALPPAKAAANVSAVTAELLQDLRSASEARVKGPLWSLPRVTTGDPQPMLKHQADALARLSRNNFCSGIVHLPTGSGKTRVGIEIAAKCLEHPQGRVIWATNGVSLLRQSVIRLVEMLGRFDRELSMRWAGSEHVQDAALFDDAHVIFVTRDTLTKWLARAADGRTAGDPLRTALTARKGSKGAYNIALIYDECHELGANGLQRAWKKFAGKVLTVGSAGERFTIIGLSATPMPTSTEAHGLLQDCIFPVREGTTTQKDWGVLVHHSESTQTLTDLKILCPINLALQHSGFFDIPERLVTRIIDETMPESLLRRGTSSEKQWAHDFSLMFNRKVMTHPDILDFLAERIARRLPEMGKTMLFCASVEAANYIVDRLRRDQRVGEGLVTLVHSRMEDRDIAELEEDTDAEVVRPEMQIQEFLARGHEPCVMVNVGMLTTGFDDPKVRCVVLARLTFSKNLFWQMIGRGLRGPFAGGTPDCYLIDPIRLTERFEVFEGYRPDVERRGIPQQDLEEQNSALHDPRDLAPLSCEREPPPEADIIIDPSIRWGVRRALRAFLGGKKFKLEKINEALGQVRITHDKDGTTRITPAGGAATAESPYAMLETHIRSLENSIGRDLPWLYGLLPTRLDTIARKTFLRKLQVIRKHRIATLEAWHEYELKRL
ncbi:MAG TPA: DEAD/DEAH box helicase family protein [Woeseiaceae bacterium]|nr:DEAD/DEAH box helicase family protein [Woeseiaceae bacterium]